MGQTSWERWQGGGVECSTRYCMGTRQREHTICVDKGESCAGFPRSSPAAEATVGPGMMGVYGGIWGTEQPAVLTTAHLLRAEYYSGPTYLSPQQRVGLESLVVEHAC